MLKEWIIGIIILWYGGSILVAKTIPWTHTANLRKKIAIPSDMQKKVKEFDKKAKNKHEFLELASKYISSQYTTKWVPYFRNPPSLYWSIAKIWRSKKILACTSLNHLLTQFLLHSKYFVPTDIERKSVFIYGVSYHEFLVINTGKEKQEVDMWKFTCKNVF